jgi:hypothetical protein
LEWEERVRFISTDELFDELHKLYIGVAGGIIDEATKLPKFMAEVFANGPGSGKHKLELELTLPDGWAEAVSAATERAVRAMVSRA